MLTEFYKAESAKCFKKDPEFYKGESAKCFKKDPTWIDHLQRIESDEALSRFAAKGMSSTFITWETIICTLRNGMAIRWKFIPHAHALIRRRSHLSILDSWSSSHGCNCNAYHQHDHNESNLVPRILHPNAKRDWPFLLQFEVLWRPRTPQNKHDVNGGDRNGFITIHDHADYGSHQLCLNSQTYYPSSFLSKKNRHESGYYVDQCTCTCSWCTAQTCRVERLAQRGQNIYILFFPFRWCK